MFELLRLWYAARRSELRARARLARCSEAVFDDLSNRYIDTDRFIYDWGTRQSGDWQSRPVSLDVARRESRAFVRQNAHARNVMNQIANFCVGPGFELRFGDPDERERWRQDAARIAWPRRRREIVRRIVRDGEAFLRRYDGQVRFVEPERVATPPGAVDDPLRGLSQGVRFSPGDVEDVQAYYVDGEEVPRTEMFHFRDPYSDLNAVRGWPVLYDAIPVMARYERWIQTRAILNELRAAIVAIRRHRDMTPTQIQSFVDRVKSGTLTRESGTTQRWAQRYMPGTIIDISDDIEMEFPAGKIDAGSVADDGRAMRLLIAAYFSMPEYWVTCDASNANFASTLVAENPGIVAMRAWQEWLGSLLVDFVTWLWGAPPEGYVDVGYPNLVARNALAETQARAIQQEHGVLSAETWMELEGRDPEIERARMASAGEV